MSNKALRTVYKMLLRHAASLERNGARLDFKMPLDKEAWPQPGGKHGWDTLSSEFHLESLRKLLPWLAQEHDKGSFDAAEVRQCIRQQFRSPSAAALPLDGRLDRAFEALRVLGEQLHLAECSSSATTQGVHVEVTSAYLGSQSELDPTYEPEEGMNMKHYFTYRIRVSNIGQELVQLVGRYWQIQDDQGKTVIEVPRNSRGVVGCTPLIKPGQCFSYYSGTDLECKTGSMHGSFQMVQLDAAQKIVGTFDAIVAPFRFIA